MHWAHFRFLVLKSQRHPRFVGFYLWYSMYNYSVGCFTMCMYVCMHVLVMMSKTVMIVHTMMLMIIVTIKG